MAATLRFEILGDDRSRAAFQSAERNARGLNGAVAATGTQADRSRRGIGRMGVALGTAARAYGPLAAAAAGYGILKIGKDSIEAASNVQQAFGAVDTVFKRNADTVKAWARAAADDVGLATSEYAQMSAVIGSSLKNTGIENFTQLSRRMVVLGADLAATYGGTVQEALTALGATLRGEYDPIERYGVTLRAADISARLAAKGLGNLTGKALAQATQQERLRILFKQTADAQGQFRRESNTAAGAQARLTAKWENAKAALGQRLIPMVTRFTGWLGETIGGQNRTGKAARWMARVWTSYAKPAAQGLIDAFRIVRDAVIAAFGSQENFNRSMRQLGRFVARTAPQVGRVLGGAFRFLGHSMATTIRIGRAAYDTLMMLTWPVRTLIGYLDDLAAAFGRAREAAGALGDIGQIAGGLSPLGFLRSADADQLRALNASPRSNPRPVVNLTSSPQVHVSFDSARFEGIIRAVVRQEFRDLAITGGI